MAIAPLLHQVYINLIAQEQLVRAIDRADGRRIEFVAVASNYTVETAAHKYRHRNGGTVGEAQIHQLLFVLISQSARHIGSPTDQVSARQERRLY